MRRQRVPVRPVQVRRRRAAQAAPSRAAERGKTALSAADCHVKRRRKKKKKSDDGGGDVRRGAEAQVCCLLWSPAKKKGGKPVLEGLDS